jgi:hypothetical protein
VRDLASETAVLALYTIRCTIIHANSPTVEKANFYKNVQSRLGR